jgi:pyridoxamine 5'-phosphate oxidase-like protein
MTTWNDVAAGAPELAAAGRVLLERSGIGEGLLATVRDDGPPRIHPVHIRIVGGRLLTFVIVGSAKAGDLAADGRYALHAHQDPAEPHEFLVRGRAVPVTEPDRRAEAAAEWSFEIDEGNVLYALSIEHAVLGHRPTADDWPPIYSSWRPAATT